MESGDLNLLIEIMVSNPIYWTVFQEQVLKVPLIFRVQVTVGVGLSVTGYCSSDSF